MDTNLEQLQRQVDTLQKQVEQLYRSASIDRNVETAFRERLFFGLNGIYFGNGSSTIGTITPLSGTKTYYVSDSNGGAVTRKLTFNNGILVAET